MVETWIYACALGVAILIQTGVYIGGFYWFRNEIELQLEELDQNLAAAIQKVVSELPLGELTGAEPPNPLQMMLMQLITNSTTKKEPGIMDVLVRDEKGQFQKVDDLK